MWQIYWDGLCTVLIGQRAVQTCKHMCVSVYMDMQHSIQGERGNKPETPHFVGIYRMSPSENHMSTGRLTCQLRHVKLDRTELGFYQFTTGLLIQI